MALTGGKDRSQRPTSFDVGTVSIGDVSTRGFAVDGVFVGQRITCLNPANEAIIAIGRDILAMDSRPMRGVIAIGENIILDSTGFNALFSSVVIGGFAKPGIEGVSIGHSSEVPSSLIPASYNTSVGAFAIITGTGVPNPVSYNFCGGYSTIVESFTCVAIEGQIGSGCTNSVAIAGQVASGLGSSTDSCGIASGHIDGPNNNCVALASATIRGNNHASFAACGCLINLNSTFGHNNIAISSSSIGLDNTNTIAICGSTVGDTCHDIFAVSTSVPANTVYIIGVQSVMGTGCTDLVLLGSRVGISNYKITAISISQVGDSNQSVVAIQGGIASNNNMVFASVASNVGERGYLVTSMVNSNVGDDCANVFACSSGVPHNGQNVVAFHTTSFGDTNHVVFAGVSHTGNRVTEAFVWNGSVYDDVTRSVAIHGNVGFRSSFSTSIEGQIGDDSVYCLSLANSTIGHDCISDICIGRGATIGNYVDNAIVIGRSASVGSGTAPSHILNPIAIGYNAVAAGSYGIALGANSSTNPGAFTVGNSATTGVDSINRFTVYGYNIAMTTALVVITAQVDPSPGFTGLGTTFNNAGTTTSKLFKAAVAPPLGSLLLYMDP